VFAVLVLFCLLLLSNDLAAFKRPTPLPEPLFLIFLFTTCNPPFFLNCFPYFSHFVSPPFPLFISEI
jgi:hypothetical protein